MTLEWLGVYLLIILGSWDLYTTFSWATCSGFFQFSPLIWDRLVTEGIDTILLALLMFLQCISLVCFIMLQIAKANKNKVKWLNMICSSHICPEFLRLLGTFMRKAKRETERPMFAKKVCNAQSAWNVFDQFQAFCIFLYLKTLCHNVDVHITDTTQLFQAS